MKEDAHETTTVENTGSQRGAKLSQADILLSLVKGCPLSTGADGKPVIEIEPGKLVTVAGDDFGGWLSLQFRAATGAFQLPDDPPGHSISSRASSGDVSFVWRRTVRDDDGRCAPRGGPFVDRRRREGGGRHADRPAVGARRGGRALPHARRCCIRSV